MKRKNYDTLDPSLTLREKIKEIKEQAIKGRRKSPDILKMYGFKVKGLPPTWYYFESKQKRDKVAMNYKIEKFIEPYEKTR